MTAGGDAIAAVHAAPALRTAPAALPSSTAAAPPSAAPAVPSASAAAQAVSVPLDCDAIWSAVVAIAGRGMDAAMIAPLRPISFDGRTLRLRCEGSDTALAATLGRQSSRIAELVERAVGRRIAVSVDPPTVVAAAPARAAASELEAARQHPLVREAMQLFDATVTEVSSLDPVVTPDPDIGEHPS